MAKLFRRIIDTILDKELENMYQGQKLHRKFWLLMKKNLRNPFITNVSVVAGGSIISQVINIAFSPLITRLFDPGIFGALGVFLSVVSILTPVAQLCYPYAIILPKNDEDSILLMQFSILFGTVFTSIIVIIVLIFQNPIAHALSLGLYTRYLYLIPASLFFSILVGTHENWLIRKKQFKIISVISVTKSFLKDATMVCMALFYPPLASLIGITIFAQGYHALASILSAQKSLRKAFANSSKPIKVFKKNTLKILNDYRDFPLFRTPQIFLNILSTSLPILMLTVLSGPIAAGLYTLCRRVVKLPTLVIGDAFAKVFEQQVAETGQSAKSIQPSLLKGTTLLLAIGTIPFGILFLFGPSLFSIVFGNEWRTAGEYARWLSIWLIFSFSNKPSVKAIPLMNLQKEFLIYEIISVFTKSVSLLIGFILFKNDISAIVIFSITGALLNISLILYVIIRSKKKIRYTFSDH